MIFLTGDTHGTFDIDKLFERNWPKQFELTRNDYLIILGDFGLYWKNNDTFRDLLEFYKSRTYTVLWVDGNHCNHDWIDSLPVENWHGGKVHRTDNIIHLMRGQIYDINGKKFLSVGGALSIDKEHRIIGESWWEREELNYAEESETIKNLESSSWTVDYVLTHAAPKSILFPMFRKREYTGSSTTEKFLDYIANNVKFTHWYFGHYHENVEYGKFSCLYSRIIPIRGDDF